MNVLIFNCGSSSLKYRLIRMPEEKELAGGEAQRIGPPTAEPSRILHRVDGVESIFEIPMASHAEAFTEVMNLLGEEMKPDAIGHRVVHGGARFGHPCVMTSKTLAELDELRHLAPIHNPPATDLIYACMEQASATPQVAVFDTAFHTTIPIEARTYALPAVLREEKGLRKYGFHGTSHQYVMEEACRFMGIPTEEFNGVSCHLGSGGASLCAIRNGASIDNTMGYSPLQGLMMSTRSGDLDPGVVMALMQGYGGSVEKVDALLNRRSGVLGLSEFSGDIRDVIAAADNGNSIAERTAQAYLWRIRKYLGAYLALVGMPQAVIFTDTIGELQPRVRWNLCAGMEAFGLCVNSDLNDDAEELPSEISEPGSSVRTFVIATNEELAIARRTYESLTPRGDQQKGNAA